MRWKLALAGIVVNLLAGAMSATGQTDDVLFVVLGKMSLYDQSPDGELTLRNHHFVAEIMPKIGGTVLGGTLHREDVPSDRYEFVSEGEAFLAHGGRFETPEALHEAHPDGRYVFSYDTEGGSMESQVVELTRRDDIDQILGPARVTLSQSSTPVSPEGIDASEALEIHWERVPEMMSVPASLVDDLTFVLVFDCFGDRVAHSGRPFQGGGFLTFREDVFVVPVGALREGLRYSVIVEQATADAQRHEGIPSIATYATLSFLDFTTAGRARTPCPAEPH